MDRLTVKNSDTDITELYCGYEDCDTVEEECPRCIMETCECYAMKDALETLARYKSTGLTPEQLPEMSRMFREKCEEVNRYEKLKEDGRMIELPKEFTDDILYYIWEDNLWSVNVRNIGEVYIKRGITKFYGTPEEAEKALEPKEQPEHREQFMNRFMKRE